MSIALNILNGLFIGYSLYKIRQIFMARKQSRKEFEQWEKRMQQMNVARPLFTPVSIGSATTNVSPTAPQTLTADTMKKFIDELGKLEYKSNVNPMGMTFRNIDPRPLIHKARCNFPRVRKSPDGKHSQKAEAYYSEKDSKVYVTFSTANGGYSDVPEMEIKEVGVDARVHIEFIPDQNDPNYSIYQYALTIGMGDWSGFSNGDIIDARAHNLPKWEPTFIIKGAQN